MAWKIDRDYINGGEGDPVPSRVGLGSGELEGPTFRFRIRDDDGEVYYGGVADDAAARDDEAPGGLYTALQWATHDAGATDLQVRPSDALEHHLTSPNYLDAVGITPETPAAKRWVSIYG
jgi:hypothetical protein